MWADPKGGKRGRILLRYEDVKSGEGLPVLIVYTGRRLMPVCCQTVAYWQIGGLFSPFNCTFVRNLWNQSLEVILLYMFALLAVLLWWFQHSLFTASLHPSCLVVFFLFIRQVLCPKLSFLMDFWLLVIMLTHHYGFKGKYFILFIFWRLKNVYLNIRQFHWRIDAIYIWPFPVNQSVAVQKESTSFIGSWSGQNHP